MSSRNEILDSEDESDFSPVKDRSEDFLYHAIPDAPDAIEQTRDQTDTNASSLKSTDPAVFQRIYDDIRAVANASHDVVPPPVKELSPGKPPPQSKATPSLTSVTSPLRNPKMARKRDVIDLTLTQVTTPSRDAASDPWDVPSSSPPAAMGALSKVARTYGKRKRATQPSGSVASDGMPPTQDPYDFPSTVDPSPAKTKKKVKRATPSSMTTRSRGSSPILLVPPVEESVSSTSKSRRSGDSLGSDSMIAETGPALYVTPSALTASQKEQYQLVNLSSEPEPSLPGPLQRSSGATTIPYSTPSQYASSRRRAGPEPLQSSPDVISEDTGPRERRSVQGEEDDLGGSAKRRRSGGRVTYVEVEVSADQGGEQVEEQEQEDTYQVQETDVVDTTTEVVQAPLESPPVPEPKKKRGRKKKEPKSSESVVEETQFEAPAEIPEDVPEVTTPAPTKRGRGRPRKSVVVPQPDTTEQENPVQGDDALPASTAKPGKKGRKKKGVAAPKSPEYILDDEAKENKSAPPLTEISRNPRPSTVEINASDEDDDDNDYDNNEETKENSPVKKVEQAPPPKAEEAVKKEVKPTAASSPAAGMKPLYRVGLSKKSRIAPLLKMIRK